MQSGRWHHDSPANALLLCRVVRDGSNWLQEEVVEGEGKLEAQHRPLQDDVIKAVLACALNTKLPTQPLWERLYDMAVGTGIVRILDCLDPPRFRQEGSSQLVLTYHWGKPHLSN